MRAIRYPFQFEYGGTAEVVNAGSWLQQSIVQWILTNRRERVHRPNFGGDIREMVFASDEEDDEIREILNRITDGVAKRFDVSILDSDAVSDDQGTMRIRIDYAVGGVPDQVFVDITDVIA